MRNSKKFGTRVRLYDLKDGDISFYITYKVKGKLKQLKIGKKSEGINELICIEHRNSILSNLRHGIDITKKSSNNNVLFKELADKYLDYATIHVKSNKKYFALYKKHILPIIGDKIVSDMNDNDILRVQRILRNKELSDATNNLVVKLIKRIVRFALETSHFDYMPFKNTKLFKLNNSRDRYLTTREINKLFHYVTDEQTKLFLHLALTTGARASAILEIKKQDIDIENKTILLKDDKRNSTYTSFVHDDVMNFISPFFYKLDTRDNIITQKKKPLKINTLRYRLKEAFDILNEGIDNNDRKNKVVIHTLRHTFASHLAINGTSIPIIQKLLNHSDIKQTMRYAKLLPESGKFDLETLYQG